MGRIAGVIPWWKCPRCNQTEAFYAFGPNAPDKLECNNCKFKAEKEHNEKIWKETPLSYRFRERICNKFLWFPKTINYETRWFVRARWREFFKPILNEWKAIEWLDI